MARSDPNTSGSVSAISTLSAGLSTATSTNVVQTANISTLSAGLSTATSVNTVQNSSISTNTANIGTLSAGLSTATSVNTVQDSNISTLSTLLDQSVKTTASPAFAGLTIAGNEPIRSIVHGGVAAIHAGNNGLGQSRPPVSKITQSDAIAGTRTSASLFTRTAGTWTIEALNDQYAFFYAAAAPTVGNWLQIVKPAVSAEILGTRTSDTIFTRSTGTWTVDALIGQYVFSYVTATSGTIGVWLPIVDNDATTLTVTGVLYAGATAIKTCANNLTTTITVNGTILAAADTVKTCPWNPIAASYAHGKGTAAFVGGVFDGQNIWLAPNSSPDLVKVNPADGSMTSYAHGKGASAFNGGVFDG